MHTAKLVYAHPHSYRVLVLHQQSNFKKEHRDRDALFCAYKGSTLSKGGLYRWYFVPLPAPVCLT